MKNIIWCLLAVSTVSFAQVQTPGESDRKSERNDMTLHAPVDPMAAKIPLEAPTMNINQGNWNIGSSLWLEANSVKNEACCQTSFEAGIEASRFIARGVALGATFSIGRDSYIGESVWALLGPRASYYFWENDKITTYAALEGVLGLTDTTIRGRVSAELGLEYFLTSSVAFGPYIEGRRVFRRVSANNYNSLIMGANFGIYL